MSPQLSSAAAAALQWLISATIILSLISNGNSFQTTVGADRQQNSRMKCAPIKMSSSFQQARLEEQLRLSTKQGSQAQSEEETASVDTSNDALSSSADDSSDDPSLQVPDKEARDLLEMENEILGPDGLPMEAPMMTYQKYLTMQVRFVAIILILIRLMKGNICA